MIVGVVDESHVHVRAAHPLETGVQGAPHAVDGEVEGRCAAVAGEQIARRARCVLVDDAAHLGGDLDTGVATFQRLAQSPLSQPVAVHGGRVEVPVPGLESSLDGGRGAVLTHRRTEASERRGAETDCRQHARLVHDRRFYETTVVSTGNPFVVSAARAAAAAEPGRSCPLSDSSGLRRALNTIAPGSAVAGPAGGRPAKGTP